MGGVLECSNGINVRPAKQWYEIMVGVDKDRELLGKFLRGRNQSQVKDHLVRRKHFENWKKFFKREKILLTLGTNFSGCDKPSPLKKNLVPRFGD